MKRYSALLFMRTVNVKTRYVFYSFGAQQYGVLLGAGGGNWYSYMLLGGDIIQYRF